MNRATVGLMTGMALAFAAWFGGFGAFLLVAALGAIGYVLGRLLDDGTDLREFLGQGGWRNR
ncbi:hypothetical protein ACFU90_15390 [Streptomyces noursei]|uniref:hypothetical protein n=1 Tax=Streptomyces TaxID=1883 RepID=UPI00045F0EBF|nr:hypothetical protein [Streptomyces noursei]AIA00829.1 hypothetical protein DC74_301 [Streptomyces noursei]MCE4941544.1 hypothetical protein [Streptomyces noursei]MCZ0974734.1 hypothetical protein [Streptomyces noursei]